MLAWGRTRSVGECARGILGNHAAPEASRGVRLPGTRGLAPYPFLDPFGRIYYQRVRVEIDEATLKTVASVGNGQFFRTTDTASLKKIYEEIDKLERSTVELTQFKQYRDLFQWFLGSGLLLLLLQMVLSQTLWRKVP